MEAVIVNFRISRHVQKPNYLVVLPLDAKSKQESEKLIGKKVIYNTGKKDMVGTITGTHGNKGAVKARFETGMPGQAVGKKVKIE